MRYRLWAIVLSTNSEPWSRDAQGVCGEAFCDDFVGLVYRICAMEEVEVAGADRAVFHQPVEIDHPVPEFGAEKHDRHALAQLVRLHQGQDLEQLVERAIAAGEQHDRLGQVDEPELAHEEVMKIEVQFSADIGVVEFLVGDRDSKPDAEPLRLGSPAIGRLHDAGTATGADDEAPFLAVERLRPRRQALGELARRFIIDREPESHLRGLDGLARPLRFAQRRLRRFLRTQPSRPHEDDGVLDVVALEAIERLQVLRKDAQGTRIFALQETGILIGLGLAARWLGGLVQSAPRFCPVVVLQDQTSAAGVRLRQQNRTALADIAVKWSEKTARGLTITAESFPFRPRRPRNNSENSG